MRAPHRGAKISRTSWDPIYKAKAGTKGSWNLKWRESQAMEGIRRMPWRSATTKDAVSCEKTWGAASRHRSMYLRMGQPGTGNGVIVRK